MIKDLFSMILNMSITASIVIMVVMLFRWIFSKQAKIFSYILWVIVLFRFICPYSFSMNISFFDVIPKVSSDNGYIEYNINEETNEIDRIMTSENNLIIHNEIKTDYKNIAADIWFIGVLFLLIKNILDYNETKKILADSNHLYENVYTSSHISTGIVVGIIKPKIYIPSSISENEIEYVLSHERTHLKRKDHIFKLLYFIACCIHWFNPLVWLSFKLMEKDMEMSCDEAVIKKLSSQDIANYSQALLNLSTYSGKTHLLSFGGNEVKNRIKNILSYNKPTAKYLIACGIVVSLLAITLMSNPVNSSALSDEKIDDTVISEDNEDNAENIVIPQSNDETDKLLFPIKSDNRISRGFVDKHKGIDIAANTGTEIYACRSGVVETAEVFERAYGHYLVINHGDYKTLYAHCDELKVSVGDEINKGDVIATVGNTGASTGPHLHLEVITENGNVDPLNYFE